MSDVLGAEISRRKLLRDAAGVTVAATLAGPGGAFARAARSAGPRRREVAVLGGGMAGLAAAHELGQRGFRVTVFEPLALGGKARSIPVAHTAAGGRLNLPGEHGFRFFPGFYHHVPDTMRRISFGGNANGVWDNLVDTPESRLSRVDNEDVFLPVEPSPDAFNPASAFESLIGGTSLAASVPPHELAYFLERLQVFFASCDERRYGQWEHVSWRDFVKAEGKSEAYNRLVVKFLTRGVVAAKEDVASTRTIGNMAEAFMMNIMGRGNDGALDRLLNAPTNEAWIRPWVKQLRKDGVRFELGQRVVGFNLRRGKIESVRVRDGHGKHRLVEADWYVCAMPAERARRLWSAPVLRADPGLELMNDLFVDWMVGLQVFLRREATLAKGHVAYMDSPWALTSISQGHFWDRSFPDDYGDGSVHDCLSIDISDWDTPGILYGKPAKRCTKQQVFDEVWAQIKASVNDRSDELHDEDVHSWFLDPAVRWSGQRRRNSNATPLLVNTVGSWEKRPTARMEIPNLFHAGDHVQTNIDLATMEGANESGRAAANAILEQSGSKAKPAAMFTLYRPPEYEGAKRIDEQRYRAGQPNLFDTG